MFRVWSYLLLVHDFQYTNHCLLPLKNSRCAFDDSKLPKCQISGEIVFLEAWKGRKSSGILKHFIGKLEEKRKKNLKSFEISIINIYPILFIVLDPQQKREGKQGRIDQKLLCVFPFTQNLYENQSSLKLIKMLCSIRPK